VKVPGLSVPATRTQPEPRQPQKLQAETGSPSSVKISKGDAPQIKVNQGAIFGALGLPADRLSASILTFARFFFLPLDQQLLSKIRRQIISAGQAEQAETTKEAPAGEALSPKGHQLPGLAFAALAAASKGVELTPEGLENYAAAMEPEPPGGEERRRQNQKKRGQDETEKQEEEAAEIGGFSDVKERALQAGEKNPLLAVMNRLPGRNGQRWLVFPFNFKEQGDEYRLCLKILLNEAAVPGQQSGYNAGQFFLDIVKTGSGGENAADKGSPKQRWLFALNSGNGKNPRLRVFLDPVKPERILKMYAAELSQLLGITPEHITMQKFRESFQFDAVSEETVLPSINEEV